uniref:malectin domain-containing carbohydrate-binding protein n=1 Tax=Chryseolinea sp. H1M3-3 TaxID=3034144 RepID=UPI0023ECC87D
GGTPYSTTTAIANTTQDPIYQTERFGNFSYAIPVGQAGTYAVDLHLAEIYFGQPGQRIFNINIENGQFVRNNLDLIQTYGANNTARVLRADNLNITDGTINITFTSVVDNAKISGIAVGRYNVAPVNTPPTITAIPNQTINGNTSTGSIPFTIGDVDNAIGSLTISGSSGDVTIIPNANIVFGGSGANRTVTVTPATNQIGGPVTITVMVSDGIASTSTNFNVTVGPANTTPVVVQAYPDQSIPSTQSSLVVNLAQIFNDDGGVNNLTFTVPTNTNAALISNTQIVGSQLTFTLTGTTGTGTITLRATDASNAFIEDVFQLTVTSSGGTPTLTNVIRINSGGTAQNFGGEAWVADQYFSGGTPYSTTTAIGNTTQDPIYQTERFGNFSYAIPVGQVGTYAVDLHLAEIYFGQSGQRVFNINIENGQFIRNNLDLIQTYGANNTANVLRADNLNITDGTINITFTSVVDNAKISGISVGRYSSAPTNTPPTVAQAPAAQSVPNTQASVVLQLGQIFSDDGGVNNLTFTVPNNTNPGLISNTQIVGTQLTLTLSGTTGSGTLTLQATDASNASVQTTFQLAVTSSGGTPTLTNVIRINAGGTAQNFGGEAWVVDQYFTGGTPYSTTTAIANTTQDPIYQTERFGNFSYAIPVGQAGTYAV